MPKFKVRVIQAYRVEREVEMEVEAASVAEAVELVDLGEVDKPEWEAWSAEWNLMDETVLPVCQGCESASEPHDTDEAAVCRTESCGGDPENGEGWDGYCGGCADRLAD